MFKIYKIPFGEYILVKIVNELTGEYFSFLPNHGASINQLALKGSNGKVNNLLHENVDYRDLITEGHAAFKGSKLFPFPNRVNNGNYFYQDKNYQLTINDRQGGHAIHGLIFDSKFRIVSEFVDKEKGVVMVEYNFDKECEGYPFQFTVKIFFELSKKGFTCSTSIKNDDSCDIPVGDGWHPYFKTSGDINGLYLSIPSCQEIETDTFKIPTGRIINTNEFIESTIIGEKNFDTCFKFFEEADRSVIKIVDTHNSLNINIWMDSGHQQYKYVQVYTPYSRDSIAIEPMSCMPDAFNNKKDLIILEPQEAFKLSWGVYLK
jgi:aldose 1-epimerase